MYVDARESSITKNVKAIVEGIQGIRFYDTLTLCSDDRESDDLLHTGHLNAVVRKRLSAAWILCWRSRAPRSIRPGKSA